VQEIYNAKAFRLQLIVKMEVDAININAILLVRLALVQDLMIIIFVEQKLENKNKPNRLSKISVVFWSMKANGHTVATWVTVLDLQTSINLNRNATAFQNVRVSHSLKGLLQEMGVSKPNATTLAQQVSGRVLMGIINVISLAASPLILPMEIVQ